MIMFMTIRRKASVRIKQLRRERKVNMLAVKWKNVNADEKLINDGEVLLDYVATKRMVVPQEKVMIGLALDDKTMDKLPQFLRI